MSVCRYSLHDFTQNLRGNLFGGVTAAIVALPLALAFGISSGIGPLAGLYGAITVGAFAAVFGGTRQQISGPTGPMTVVVTAMTAHYLSQYPEQGLALVFTTVFLGGVLQVAIGLLKLGKYIIMVPYPVISGFMSGIGVIIIVLQLAPFLGHPGEGNIVAALTLLPQQLLNPNVPALLIALLGLILLFVWRGRVNQWLPAPLLVLVVTTVAAQLLFAADSMAVIGDIPSALPQLHMPVFKLELIEDMLVNAVMLAVLGSIDSLLTSLVADNMCRDVHDSNQELIGQGLGNALAGLVGGLPGAGATMRTVVNIRAGGDGPLSGLTHALVLVSALVGLGFLFAAIPLAALAAVLIKVGIDIIDWPFLLRLRQLPRFTVALMLLVLLLTVFVDLITAVFVGVFIKNLMVLEQLSNLELGNVIIDDGLEDAPQVSEAEHSSLQKFAGQVALLRITGPLSYAVSRGLTRQFNAMKTPRLLLLDLSTAAIIGVSTTLAIEQLLKTLRDLGTAIKVINEQPDQIRDAYHQLGLLELIGRENFVGSFDAALASGVVA